MSQTINLLNAETQSNTYTAEQFDYNATDLTMNPTVVEAQISDSTLHLMFPGRILFSINETATILNVSYEFVRSRTMSQVIPSVDIGNRRMVNIDTINYLINNGI